MKPSETVCNCDQSKRLEGELSELKRSQDSALSQAFEAQKLARLIGGERDRAKAKLASKEAELEELEKVKAERDSLGDSLMDLLYTSAGESLRRAQALPVDSGPREPHGKGGK